MTNLEKASEMVENNPELKGKLEAEIRRPMENKEMDTNRLNMEEQSDSLDE